MQTLQEELERLGENNAPTSLSFEETSSTIKYRTLAFQYQTASLLFIHPEKPSNQVTGDLVKQNPYGFASYVFESLQIHLVYPSEPPEWLSTLQHLFIIWTSLLALSAFKIRPDTNVDAQRCTQFAADQLKALFRSHLEVDRPDLAFMLYYKLDLASKYGL